MGRFTNALVSALPVAPISTSDTSPQPLREHALIASPSEAGPSSGRGSFEPYDRHSIAQALIYDDPRSTHFGSTPSDRLYLSRRFDGRSGRSDSASRTRRPELLRHVSDNAVTMTGRSGSGVTTPTARAPSAGRDRGVRVNLGGAKRRERVGAMCKGPEGRYAVGGPQYLRVLQVVPSTSGSATPSNPKTASPRRGPGQMLGRGAGGTTINEVANLWKGSWAVSKGVNDIDWGAGSYDKKVVTATPSGNYMLFDLTKNRLEKDVSGGHPRPLNCVRLCQTPSYGHLLLTGSTEGIAKIWDMRDGEPVSKKYYKHSAPVTSMAFSPADPHIFVIGTENGAIKRYDMRMAPRPTATLYGAHGNKAVMDLKWRGAWEGEVTEYAGSSGWMASAGADKTVQIWDMTQSWDKPPTPLHTLHTAYPLRRVSWRPSRPTEIVIVPLNQPLASAGDTDDASADDDAHIEIWDVRRHYVAKYALPSLDGTAVDIAWGENANTLVTAFQNGVMAQLDMRERTLPLETVPRQVVAWNPHGELAYGLDRFRPGEIPFDDLKPEYANHWHHTGQPVKGVSDAPHAPLQAIGFIDMPNSDPEEFVHLAQQYRIDGDTPENLCRWNGEVAEMCGHHDTARMWSFLRTLIEEFAPASTKGGGTFDEAIFSHPIPHVDRVPSPLNASPRGGHSDLPTPSSRSRSPVTSLREHAIQLDRVDPGEMDDSDSVEELVEELPSISGASTLGVSVSRSGKIMSFAPPDARRLSEARASISTIVPRRSSVATVMAPTPRMAISHLPSATPSSVPTRVSTPSTQDQTRSSRSRKLHASSPSDYPDPYGIDYPSSTPSQATSSKMTTREPSPVRRADPQRARVAEETGRAIEHGDGVIQLTTSTRSTRHNSRDKAKDSSAIGSHVVSSAPTRSGSGTQPLKAPTNTHTGDDPRRKSSGSMRGAVLSSSGRVGSPVTRLKVDPSAREEKAAKEEARVYRQERSRPLLHWWKAALDEGDVQLAATVLIVGAAVLTFPKKQSERILHAYIDMLDRARLPVQSAYIRKYAQILSLEIYTQDTGITHITHCQRCRKATGSLEDIGSGKKFWWCRRCRLAARTCVICRQGVKGMWMSCGRCGHGGHQKCIRMYYLSAPLHTLPPSAQAPSSSQGGSSGLLLQRTNSTAPAGTGTGTSHDSSGFIIGASLGQGRASHETLRDQLEAAGIGQGAGEIVRGWNVCPDGCGCRCRAVVAVREGNNGGLGLP